MQNRDFELSSISYDYRTSSVDHRLQSFLKLFYGNSIFGFWSCNVHATSPSVLRAFLHTGLLNYSLTRRLFPLRHLVLTSFTYPSINYVFSFCIMRSSIVTTVRCRSDDDITIDGSPDGVLRNSRQVAATLSAVPTVGKPPNATQLFEAA